MSNRPASRQNDCPEHLRRLTDLYSAWVYVVVYVDYREMFLSAWASCGMVLLVTSTCAVPCMADNFGSVATSIAVP